METVLLVEVEKCTRTMSVGVYDMYGKAET